MPKIISEGTPNPDDLKENPLKDLWYGFRSMDRFLKMSLFSGILLIVFGVYAAGNLLETRQRAGGEGIARVDIDPGELTISVNAPNKGLSTLAYDFGGNPIWDGVLYEWSMSSTNSVGTLTNTLGNITEFDPLKSGCGALTVVARLGDQTITKSIQVEIQPSALSGQPAVNCGTPSGKSQRVFVTSTSYDGNLGGLEGADAKCQERANAANLGGQWRAWLSDSNSSTKDRLIHANGPYKRIDGAVIANNWEDLVDGNLQNSIHMTELGASAYGWYVWTYTNANGTSQANYNSYNCHNWTSSGGREDLGIVGNNGQTNNYWTQTVLNPPCNGFYQSTTPVIHLYCFEQVSESDITPTPTEMLTPAPISPTPTLPPTNQTLQLTPIADSYVRSSSPKTNFGSSNELWMDGNPSSVAYIKFDLTQLSGKEVLNAKLRLRVANIQDASSKGTFRIKPVADTSWGEKTVKYNNRPALGTASASFSNVALGQNVEVDLTSLVRSSAGSLFSIGIDTGSADGAVVRPREATSASNRPALIIEYR